MPRIELGPSIIISKGLHHYTVSSPTALETCPVKYCIKNSKLERGGGGGGEGCHYLTRKTDSHETPHSLLLADLSLAFQRFLAV